MYKIKGLWVRYKLYRLGKNYQCVGVDDGIHIIKYKHYVRLRVDEVDHYIKLSSIDSKFWGLLRGWLKDFEVGYINNLEDAMSLHGLLSELSVGYFIWVKDRKPQIDSELSTALVFGSLVDRLGLGIPLRYYNYIMDGGFSYLTEDEAVGYLKSWGEFLKDFDGLVEAYKVKNKEIKYGHIIKLVGILRPYLEDSIKLNQTRSIDLWDFMEGYK